jgi:hypothetical protein
MEYNRKPVGGEGLTEICGPGTLQNGETGEKRDMPNSLACLLKKKACGAFDIRNDDATLVVIDSILP